VRRGGELDLQDRLQTQELRVAEPALCTTCPKGQLAARCTTASSLSLQCCRLEVEHGRAAEETTMNGKGFSLLAPSGSLPALLVTAVLVLAAAVPAAFVTAQPAAAADAATIPPDQLDSLVAPIALYPDPLLAQVLAASTYPIEIVELQQWLTKNSGLKDKALTEAVQQQPWDASVQALAGMPDVVKRLSDDIQWTTNLGNAFLAQQNDVMAAVQRMRSKAKSKGTLESTEQQVVQTKTVENQQVIVIEQANPQVVYVPSYNPTVVYGPPVYPYPPVYYPPPPPPGSMLISFGVGMAMGAMMSGGWGYNCGWGHSNTVVINNNNTYINNQNVRTGNRNVNNNWQHNGAHRGGTPYPNASTANRYGGTTRGASTANRQANAQQQIARQGGSAGDRAGASGGGGARQGAGVSDRSAPGGGGGAREGGSVSDRSAGAGGGAGRSGGAGDSRPAGGGGQAGSGQDRIGSRDLSASSGREQRSGFGGGSDGFSGARAKETSSRGASSRGGRSGGGGKRR
jgi:hypothetical protein